MNNIQLSAMSLFLVVIMAFALTSLAPDRIEKDKQFSCCTSKVVWCCGNEVEGLNKAECLLKTRGPLLNNYHSDGSH
jgi:hypothetical protein